MGFEIESNDQPFNSEIIIGSQNGEIFSSCLNHTPSELFDTAFDIASFALENSLPDDSTAQSSLEIWNFGSSETDDDMNTSLFGALSSLKSNEETETDSAAEDYQKSLESANEGELVERTSIEEFKNTVDKLNKATPLNGVVSSLVAEELAAGDDFRTDILEKIIESRFGKIYVKGSDLPFAQHPGLIGEIKDELKNCHPSERSSKLLKTIKKYISNLELYRFNANGEKVPLSSEEKEKIASEIEKHFYLFDTQKPSDSKKESGEKEFRVQDRHDIERAPVTQLNGQTYVQEARAQTGPIIPLAFFVVDETRILSAAKKEQKIKEEQIDLAERIREMAKKREILKKEKSDNEINHFEIRAVWMRIKIQSK